VDPSLEKYGIPYHPRHSRANVVQPHDAGALVVFLQIQLGEVRALFYRLVLDIIEQAEFGRDDQTQAEWQDAVRSARRWRADNYVRADVESILTNFRKFDWMLKGLRDRLGNPPALGQAIAPHKEWLRDLCDARDDRDHWEQRLIDPSAKGWRPLGISGIDLPFGASMDFAVGKFDSEGRRVRIDKSFVDRLETLWNGCDEALDSIVRDQENKPSAKAP
jgi:hypothetical protein